MLSVTPNLQAASKPPGSGAMEQSQRGPTGLPLQPTPKALLSLPLCVHLPRACQSQAQPPGYPGHHPTCNTVGAHQRVLPDRQTDRQTARGHIQRQYAAPVLPAALVKTRHHAHDPSGPRPALNPCLLANSDQASCSGHMPSLRRTPCPLPELTQARGHGSHERMAPACGPAAVWPTCLILREAQLQPKASRSSQGRVWPKASGSCPRP